MAIIFDTINKVIKIESPATEVTIQNLINAVRDFEDSSEGMVVASIANAYGKQDLGGDVKIGITLELINDWRIQFEDQISWVNRYIKGGNLVAVNQYDNDPIKPAVNVNTILAQSTSASIVFANGGGNSEEIADAVWDESRSEHIASGSFGEKSQKEVPSESIDDYKADIDYLAMADAVWDEIMTGHVTDDTFGKLVQLIKAKTDVIDWDMVEFLWNEAGGEWKFENSQMVFYKRNGEELIRFNLYDVKGKPTIEHAVRRVPA